MPDTSTILSLPYILPAQAQKHVTHNEALRQLDVIVQLAVTARNLAVPPAAAVQGDRYIVAAAASGDWAGKSTQVALFDAGAWQFFAPVAGWTAWIAAESALASYNGSAWLTLADGPQRFSQIGVSATADATNRLAVSSPATLLNHAGAGHHLKLNKATATDTASLLFQTGFSGRAEMGTAGNDDFSVKVSADGSAFVMGLSIAGASGQVTLPAALRLGGQAADPVSPSNGMIWLNTTTGEVKVRSNGANIVIASASGITNPQLANMAAATFKARDTGSAGAPQDLTPAQAVALLPVMTSTARGLAPPSGGGSTTFLRADGSWAAPTVAGVTNTQLANMAAASFKGRDAGAAGAPQDLTSAQVAALLPVVTSTARGLAPPSGGGSTTFLRADGTWAVPPVSGGLPSLGITATAAQINPMANAFDNAFLGAGSTGNLMVGAADFTATAIWPAATVWQGINVTKTVGRDADGQPYADFVLTGTATASSALTLHAFSAFRVPAAVNDTMTLSAIMRVVSGTLPANKVRLELVGETSANVSTGNFGNSAFLAAANTTDTMLSGSATLAAATTAQARSGVVVSFAINDTFNCTIRLKGLQLDRAALRQTYAFKALSAAEARSAMGLALDGNGRLPAAVAPPWGFTSSQQTITAGSTLTVAHGLGAKPTRWQVSMICTTADLGYAVGDEIEVPFTVTNVAYGAIANASSANILIRTAVNGILLMNASWAYAVATAASWRYIVRASL